MFDKQKQNKQENKIVKMSSSNFHNYYHLPINKHWYSASSSQNCVVFHIIELPKHFCIKLTKCGDCHIAHFCIKLTKCGNCYIAHFCIKLTKCGNCYIAWTPTQIVHWPYRLPHSMPLGVFDTPHQCLLGVWVHTIRQNDTHYFAHKK